jgi:hypothetical protein
MEKHRTDDDSDDSGDYATDSSADENCSSDDDFDATPQVYRSMPAHPTTPELGRGQPIAHAGYPAASNIGLFGGSLDSPFDPTRVNAARPTIPLGIGEHSPGSFPPVPVAASAGLPPMPLTLPAMAAAATTGAEVAQVAANTSIASPGTPVQSVHDALAAADESDDSDDEGVTVRARLRRRREAVAIAARNLRCQRVECDLEPDHVQPLRLIRQIVTSPRNHPDHGARLPPTYRCPYSHRPRNLTTRPVHRLNFPLPPHPDNLQLLNAYVKISVN